MNRWLTAITLAAFLVACREETTTTKKKDMTQTTEEQDMTGEEPGDMAVTPTDGAGAVEATINDIDNGNVPKGTMVTVKGAIVVGIAKFDGTTSKGNCKYSAWVQDPAGAAPAGVKLYFSGMACTASGDAGCKCPYPPMTGTDVDKLVDLGDEVTVTGKVDIYAPQTDAGLGTPQHEITFPTVEKTGTGTVKPLVVTDGNQLAINSSFYPEHEGMLITFKPSTKITIGATDKYGAWDANGAHFVDDYSFTYGGKTDAGTFPATGATFTSITGVATVAYGGGIAPRIAADFVK